MAKFPQLNLPVRGIRPILTRRGVEIHDPLRRRTVMLTPEEWVRQHFVAYLVACLDYPAALMGNEVSISLNGTSKRCDTVVFDRHARPLAIVEYKAPTVSVTRRVFDQIVRYNMVLHVPVLMVSNGMVHYACRVTSDGYVFLPALPRYDQLAEPTESLG